MNDINRALDDDRQRLDDDRQRLAHDLRAVVDDAESLLRHAADGAGHGYAEARTRLEQSLRTARTGLAGIEQALLDRVTDAGMATDRYVRRNPWEAVGVGAGIGLLVGLLVGRR